MTEALQKAWNEISKLPPDQQDTVAALILAELASERKWDELFAKSPEKLEKLANEAWEEFERGETEPLEPL